MRRSSTARFELGSPILLVAVLITCAAAAHLGATAMLLRREAVLRAKAQVESEISVITGVDRIAPTVAALSSLERALDADPRASFYLATDPQGHRLAGNLRVWPNGRPDAAGWYSLGRPLTAGAPAVARVTRLDGYYPLIVGREVNAFGWPMQESLALFGLFVLSAVLMAVGVAAAWARHTQMRLGQINAALEGVTRSELRSRAPVGSGKGAIGVLAGNVNLAMDQIEELVTGYRTLADRVAHELKRPLALVKLALDRPGSPEAAMRSARIELDRALETFEAVMTLSELRAGLEQSRTALSLDALVQEAVELYAPVAEIKGVEITATLQPTSIRGSEAELRRLLANLLDNAVKYTPSHTRVVVSTERHGAESVVCITDQGVGPAGLPPAPGKPFERGSSAVATEGLGLGLSIARIIAARHRASLELRAAMGGGLVVEVRFPSLADQTPRPPSVGDSKTTKREELRA